MPEAAAGATFGNLAVWGLDDTAALIRADPRCPAAARSLRLPPRCQHPTNGLAESVCRPAALYIESARYLQFGQAEAQSGPGETPDREVGPAGTETPRVRTTVTTTGKFS